MSDIGGVLVYRVSGTRNGIGIDVNVCEYAVVFHGSPDSATAWVHQHIRDLEKAGYEVTKALFVRSDEGHNPIREITLSNEVHND